MVHQDNGVMIISFKGSEVAKAKAHAKALRALFLKIHFLL